MPRWIAGGYFWFGHIWTYLDMVDMIWDECRLPSLAGNVQRWKMRKLQVLIGQASPRMFWKNSSHHSHELRTDCPSLLQLDADWYYRVLKHVWICVRGPPARRGCWIDCSHELILCFLVFLGACMALPPRDWQTTEEASLGELNFIAFTSAPWEKLCALRKSYMNCSGDSVTGHRWESNSISPPPPPSYACNMYVTLCNYFLDPLGALCKHTFFLRRLVWHTLKKMTGARVELWSCFFQTSPRLGLMRMSDHTGRFRLKMSDLLPFVEPWLVSADVLGIMEVYKYPRQSSMFVYVSVISSGCF